jgi:hypothetical protein
MVEMIVVRRTIASLILFAITCHFAPIGRACGPSSIDPIFVFKKSPDFPFTQYVHGNLGIVRPTFGRKTLVIAYRYLNGGWFSDDEQSALVAALQGKAPEDDGTPAVKAWVAARKEILPEEETPPQIYTEQRFRSYEFFPNCAKNAFEVATSTLKDRAATYGAQDVNVRSWLAAQDIVFQNCQGAGALPDALGTASPLWLRKDREYQIAAALLYSLKFDEARARFEKIAADGESPWQQTAEYLVGRTLVRQASLTGDARRKRELYDLAEQRLQILAQRRGAFSNGAQKLLGLIAYRVHPEHRVRELARVLAHETGNENLKQDVIDYVWLLDKLEDRAVKEEAARRKANEPPSDKDKRDENSPERETEKKYEAVRKGELISILLPGKFDGSAGGYPMPMVLYFKPDVTEAEVLREFEAKIGRPLTPDERENLHSIYDLEMKAHAHRVSPNSKYDEIRMDDRQGCEDFDDTCERLTLSLLPEYLSADDLTNWIFTMQTTERDAYTYAFAKWRETQSTAWLAAALTKADKSSARVDRLILEAEKTDQHSAAFPTIAYQLVRLKIDQGRKIEARNLLDRILNSQAGELPVSARNQFLMQRAHLADSVTEFLRYAQQRVVAFSGYEGGIGTMRDLARFEKNHWNLYHEISLDTPGYTKQTKEEFEKDIDDSYEEFFPWDDRLMLDDETVEALNWHFPLVDLEQAARNPILPDYLRRHFVLAVWTRAIVLNNDEVAMRIAPEVIKAAPELEAALDAYVKAQTKEERRRTALYALLKSPTLSPLIPNGIPQATSTAEQSNYDFEIAWWYALATTDYNMKEEREVAKVVPKPVFLNAQELETAQRERAALIAAGDGKSYLGRRVLEWAKESPNDARIPEALFIAVKANESYKYGCNGWENDKDTLGKLVETLQTQYRGTVWAARLAAERERP